MKDTKGELSWCNLLAMEREDCANRRQDTLGPDTTLSSNLTLEQERETQPSTCHVANTTCPSEHEEQGTRVIVK